MEAPVRIQVKVYALGGVQAPSHALIPVFHRWIQTQALDELLIDVTDYGHVHHGPGVLLVGHEADHAYDLGEARAGLLYTRKRGGPDGLEARLTDAAGRALRAAALLEGEPALAGALRFDGGELLLRFPDRLRAPNAPETFEALRPSLAVLAARLWPGAEPSLSHEGDRRAPLTVRARGPAAGSIAELAARLA